MGIGRALAGFLEKRAGSEDRTELLVNSGRRYRRTGWPFWTRMYGQPIAVAEDYYGPLYDAMIWRKALTGPK